MGRKSTKPNKNIYFISREEAKLTRANVEALDLGMTESRLEKIETDKAPIHPEDVVMLANAYKKPELCNYFCTHECAIGKTDVPTAKDSSLSEIVLGILSTFNALDSYKNRLIEITADSIVSDDEVEDFKKIKAHLDNMDSIVEALKLWVKKTGL